MIPMTSEQKEKRQLPSHDEIVAKFNNPETKRFFGTVFGGDSRYEKVLEIKITRSPAFNNPWIGREGDRFRWAWGWPGPDISEYKFDDYGRTWAWTLDDFDHVTHLTGDNP